MCPFGRSRWEGGKEVTEQTTEGQLNIKRTWQKDTPLAANRLVITAAFITDLQCHTLKQTAGFGFLSEGSPVPSYHFIISHFCLLSFIAINFFKLIFSNLGISETDLTGRRRCPGKASYYSPPTPKKRGLWTQATGRIACEL